jgi:multicomponent Na+:H+ antiporter subunit D
MALVLTPLPVILPLLAAAALTATSSLTPRRVADTVATLVAVAATALCAVLLAQSTAAPLVYAFGGWRPTYGVVLGILFVIDPLGAGLATVASALITASFVFSWHYFEDVKSHFHVLMLVFLGAMIGFCLTGDLFNLFVFFELMGVAAFALTAYKTEETGPLQGALNFAIVNSVGAFFILTGIGLLYGRTGALNLAQIGRSLGHGPAGGLEIVAFALITCGFFVKAALVPFHFWLADAHAVAPTPVCVLFSGVMVELGLYAVVRVYWTVFAGTMQPHASALRALLIAVGVLTAILGALMCPLQHHLKRLLAFSTISHVGMFLIGAGLLTPLGLAGCALYVLAHAPVKAALFLCTGILLNRIKSVDENALRGRGRQLPFTGALFVAGGLGLAALPPFGTFLGKGMIEDAAAASGYAWVTVVLVGASILTGGAVLRAAGSVFLGWGYRHEDTSSRNEGKETQPESKQSPSGTPAVMFVPALVLILAGLLVGLTPHLAHAIAMAAVRFENSPAYFAAVFSGVVHITDSSDLGPAVPTASMVLSGIVSAGGAIVFALLSLFSARLPAALRKVGARLGGPAAGLLRRAQSGHVGDYVTWLTLGVAAFGAVCAFALR